MNNLKQNVMAALEGADFKILDNGDRVIYWRARTSRIIGAVNFKEYPILVGFGAGTDLDFASEFDFQLRLVVSDEHASELIEAIINDYNSLSCN